MLETPTFPSTVFELLESVKQNFFYLDICQFCTMSLEKNTTAALVSTDSEMGRSHSTTT